MRRRIYMDFDPTTQQPTNPVMVIHPSQVESIKKQTEEWAKDPAFVAEMDQIRLQKLEEWRARESRRKLVD